MFPLLKSLLLVTAIHWGATKAAQILNDEPHPFPVIHSPSGHHRQSLPRPQPMLASPLKRAIAIQLSTTF